MDKITFDHVFVSWLTQEIGYDYEERDLLTLAKTKGFDSIAEWRLATAKRLGMDQKSWEQITIENPAETLPSVLIGPFQGWSKFFQNEMNTSFAQAIEIPEFFQWAKSHNRIGKIAADFPQKTNLILYRKPDGQFIHIEGGHRLCAVAYGAKIRKPAKLGTVTAYVADISEPEIENLRQFLKLGTNKQ